MGLSLNSPLKLVSLEIRKDKKNYIVENSTSGEFYEMPEICIDAIQLINKGEKLTDIEKQLLEKYPAQEVTLLDFANQLKELELIAEIDGVTQEAINRDVERSGFSWISPAFAKFFFNKFAFGFYALLIIWNIYLMILHPSLFPHYKDLFISKYMVLNVPVLLVITYTLVLFHEIGHILAMRAIHFPTKLTLGHRLFFVVFETDVSQVWKLPYKKRYGIFIAGICFDTIVLSIALATQMIFPNGSAFLLSMMQIVVLNILIGFAFQCCVYMKTDLYFVLENFFSSYNLMENAQQSILGKIPFLKKNLREEVTFEHEKGIVFIYSIFYFIGVLLTINIFVFYFIPQIIFGWRNVWPGYTSSPSDLAFWDSALFTLQVFLFIAILLRSWRKKYRRT